VKHRNVYVFGRTGSDYEHIKGRVVGEKPCQLESCEGRRLAVRWPDGTLTWPCVRGMGWDDKENAWRIDP